ncbi:flavin oxidoreductase [Marivivens niveibacter]|uniref:Flavin oxidoreductase n=1 Tax=Marivivens niveibacter TaxID=1930667 RepID=A0A251WVE0_9RHOB|nr:flavin reductase family protein [Marivivens niveibacter]OUD08449.1 flavin oxidoreductase [Marivivens niveibacter]
MLRLAEPMHSFVPDTTNHRSLRDAFGQFATGVTIVTAGSDAGPVAITANSFSSVSLDPPLVLWSPQKTSRRFPYFVGADHFAIHVLSSDQKDLCWSVAKEMDALNRVDFTENEHGVPLLDGCLARFECARHAVHDGGDHDIIIGHVLRASVRDDGDPLAFYQGKMTRISH